MTVALTAQSDAEITVRAADETDANFAFEVATRDTTITPGSEVASVEDDKLITTETGATVDHEADINLADVVPGTVADLTIRNLDTGVATATLSGSTIAVDRVSDGTARILMDHPYLSRRADVPVSRETPATVTRITGGVAGSAREHATGAVDDNLTGNELARFTTADHATPTYVHNPDCWAVKAGLPIGCISVWSSQHGTKYGATLITKRHAASVKHVLHSVGTTLRWVDPDTDAVTDRTITGRATVPGHDVTIYTLSSDVPSGLTPAKVLPDDYLDFLPAGDTTEAGERIPVLAPDQDNDIAVADVRNLDSDDFYSSQAPTDATRLTFYKPKVVGDSGKPKLMAELDAAALVLLGVLRYGGAGSGPAVHALKTEINTAIAAADADASVSTGYTLTEASLTDYIDYSRPNLLRWTEQLDNAAWSGSIFSFGTVDVTADQAAAPDGTMTADLLAPNDSNSDFQQTVTGVSAGTSYVWSVYLKSTGATRSTTLKIARGSNEFAYATNNINVTGEWVRYEVSGTLPAGETSLCTRIGGSSEWNADEDLYAWGAQLQTGTTASAYQEVE